MLEELQSLSEAKKKQVLIIATIIVMVVVIGVWITYFNSIIVGTSQQTAQEASSTVATSTVVAGRASGPGLWQDIKNGFGWAENLFKKPSQYNIQPK
jgi:hypothetical protein